jgi:hypothetical protein
MRDEGGESGEREDRDAETRRRGRVRERGESVFHA